MDNMIHYTAIKSVKHRYGTLCDFVFKVHLGWGGGGGREGGGGDGWGGRSMDQESRRLKGGTPSSRRSMASDLHIPPGCKRITFNSFFGDLR